MWLCTAFCTLWLMWLTLVSTNVPKIICYYKSPSTEKIGHSRLEISDIDPTLCTHLIYAYVGITDDGGVRVSQPTWDLSESRGIENFQKLNALRKRNEKLKILVSTGGWDEGSWTYSKVVANAALRSKYVENVVDFLLRYEFDGFDFDWQWPTFRGGSPNDVQNYVLLLKELRASFDEHKLILSILVEGSEEYAEQYYDVPQISNYVHFLLLDTSCHYPSDLTTGHSAPLYPAAREISNLDRTQNINASIHYWLSQGTPAEKMILGTRFYGMSYILNNSAEHVPGSPATGPDELDSPRGYVGYNKICRYITHSAWTSIWDEEQRVPYLHAGNRWITYDNVKSLTEKAKYVQDLGLGGVMAWSFNLDDHSRRCGERFPLLNALNCELRKIGCSSVSTSDAATTSKTDMTEDEVGKSTCARFNTKYVRHPKSCEKFWLCAKTRNDDFRAVPFSCGDGLYFDTSNNNCKNENLVQCS